MGCGPAIPAGFQAALERFNPRLRVRWDIERDLWLVEEQGRTDGNWYYVLFWADRDPKTMALSYRPLPETPGPILERLTEIDMARFARTPRAAWKSLVAEMDGERKQVAQARLTKQQDDTRQSVREKWAYYMKGKRTFDFGRASSSGVS